MKTFWWVFKQDALFVIFMSSVSGMSIITEGRGLWPFLYLILSVIVLYVYSGSDFSVYEMLCNKHSLYPSSLGKMCIIQQRDKLSKYFPLCWIYAAINGDTNDLDSSYKDYVNMSSCIIGGYSIIKIYQTISLIAVAICSAISIMYNDIDMLCLVPVASLFYVLTDIVLKSAIITIFLHKRRNLISE